MLIDLTLFGVIDKVADAISLLQQHEPPEGYYVCFSGGKDSIVVADLCKRAGVRHELHYDITTLDPPQLLKFIHANYPNVIYHEPPQNIWELMLKHLFPHTQRIRYCTKALKVSNGQGRLKVTGIRRQESRARQNRRDWEPELNQLNPIVGWSTAEIWEYIRGNNMPYCELYDQGFTRLGCVLCPQQGKAERELHLRTFPEFVAKFKETFNEIMAERQRLGKFGRKAKFHTGEELWNWWITR